MHIKQMETRELLIYPVEATRKNKPNLEQNVKETSEVTPQSCLLPGTLLNPTKQCLNSHTEENPDKNFQSLTSLGPRTGACFAHSCNHQELDNPVETNTKQGFEARPFKCCESNSNNDALPVSPLNSINNTLLQKFSSQQLTFTPQNSGNFADPARFQANSTTDQLVNPLDEFRTVLIHNFSTSEEASLRKAVEILNSLIGGLESDSRESTLFPKNVCIKLEHHAARARNALKEIQGVLGEKDTTSTAFSPKSYGTTRSNLNVSETEKDLEHDNRNKAIVESVHKLELQITQLKELLQ